ncbi:MAG TPA: hypothetical protein VFV38_15760 [Ktedonobacteraceae bacterium]|nr:hypothetical protein [Ktedonobacteraceae bacterium]
MMNRRSILHFALGAFGAVNTKSRLFASEVAPQRSIVGAWHLLTVGAPVLHHGFLFHSDRTVCSFQADGGSALDSESDGAGQWEWIGKNQVQAAFLEFRYSRETHEYLGYIRVNLIASLNEDAQTFTGQAHARIYDAQGNLIAEATPALSAQRIPLH